MERPAFTSAVHSTVAQARREMRHTEGKLLTPRHLARAVVRHSPDAVWPTLAPRARTREAVLALLEQPGGPSEPAAIAAADVVYSAESKAAFEAAVAPAHAGGRGSSAVDDKLHAIIKLDEGKAIEGPQPAGAILRSAGLTPETIEAVRDALEARVG
jgi:hypothetical protein